MAVPKSSRKKPSATLTHFDTQGRARMVDVGDKAITQREAVAKGSVIVAPATLAKILEGKIGKGDVLGVARLAGIMAAKRTPELIPLCQGITLSAVEIELDCDAKRHAVDITATCRSIGQTGVEMEAITAVSVASLTVYDMCKAIDSAIRITDIRLTKKSGGKSGDYRAN